MKQAESSGMSHRRLLAMAGVSAGGAMLTPRPLFADRGGIPPASVNPAAEPKNISFSSLSGIAASKASVKYARQKGEIG
jgi:hypothetical protein